jgi:hypothetical protein
VELSEKDVVRHKLVREIIEAYQKDQKNWVFKIKQTAKHAKIIWLFAICNREPR